MLISLYTVQMLQKMTMMNKKSQFKKEIKNNQTSNKLNKNHKEFKG